MVCRGHHCFVAVSLIIHVFLGDDAKQQPKKVITMTQEKEKPFDMMNSIAAHLLLNLTRYDLGCQCVVLTQYSSMRFEGTLNVDLNEITMNLVPYPKLHFLL